MDSIQSIQWLQSLQSFINRLLVPIVKTQDERNKYISKDKMKIWAKAFTHESVSLMDNYEELEYRGDAVLKYVFPKYLMARFPEFRKNDLTEINILYMSKMKQAEFSTKLGLGSQVRILGMDRSILNVDTDVFESFFGALDQISDDLVNGLGAVNCYNMIVFIFKDVVIDESMKGGSDKTQVQQLFSRFELGKPDEIVRDEGANVNFAVKLTEPQLLFLSTYNVRPNPIIGQNTAFTKIEAEAGAFAAAKKYLESLGISTEWAKAEKKVRDFADPAIVPYVPALSQKIKQKGYDSIYFFIPRKLATKNGALVELVGVKGKREDILAHTYTRTRENGYRDGKLETINIFLQQK